MAHWVGTQGQVKLAKKTQNTPTCDVPPENPELESKNVFFQSKLEALLNL